MYVHEKDLIKKRDASTEHLNGVTATAAAAASSGFAERDDDDGLI